MFSITVKFIFFFLEADFGFIVRTLNDRAVQYELGDVFVRISHSTLDEVSLRVGLLRSKFEKGFSAGAVMALASPSTGFSLYDRIASKPEHVEQALRELAQLLVEHGQRVLNADPTVFDDMQRLVDDYWADRNDSQIRLRAETAFAAKNFVEALQQYRLLGERRRPLDSKRMEMCERSCQ